MLTKLIKHEFRATGRIMLPLMLALVLLSVMSAFASRYLNIDGDNILLTTLSIISLVMFVTAIFAVGVSALIIMILRFYKNFYGDEGYLMFTLPVSTDSLLWSKLLVSSIWFILTGLLCAASVLFLFAFNEPQLISGIPNLLKSGIEAVGTGNTAAYSVEFIILIFLSLFGTCLHYYFAIALGHCASKHKILMSVLAFFGISIAFNIISNIIAIPLFSSNVIYTLEDFIETKIASPADMISFMHIIFAAAVFISVVVDAVIYIPTRLLLKHKLNLT